MIFLFLIGIFFRDEFLQGHIHWDMHLDCTKNVKNSNEELYISKDALYAPESTTNTPES